MDYSIYLIPDRSGNGPALWGYMDGVGSSMYLHGSINGPFHQKSVGANHGAKTMPSKVSKGYQPVGDVPPDQLPTFLAEVVKVQSSWDSIPLGTLHQSVAKTLRQVRMVLGMGSSHPDDSRPPSPPPPHRRPMAKRFQVNSNISWMF
jgi:hypothetical protein